MSTMYPNNIHKLLLALTTLVSVPTAASTTPEPGAPPKPVPFAVYPTPRDAQAIKLLKTMHDAGFKGSNFSVIRFIIRIPLADLDKAKNELGNKGNTVSDAQNILNQVFWNAGVRVSVKAIYGGGIITKDTKPLKKKLKFVQLTSGDKTITISSYWFTYKEWFGVIVGLLLASGALYAYFSGAQEDAETTEKPNANPQDKQGKQEKQGKEEEDDDDEDA